MKPFSLTTLCLLGTLLFSFNACSPATTSHDNIVNNEEINSKTPIDLDKPVFVDNTQTLKIGRNIFNNDWEFVFSSDSFNLKNLAGLKWEKIGLPHSFSIPYFRAKTFPIGEGLYRKTLHVNSLNDLNYRLDFEGVFQVCDIYVNGIRAGGHAGGYTGFDVNLTPYLKIGDNQILVRVDNKWRAQLPPRAGEHVFSGGIYRDVYLHVYGPKGYKRNGIKIAPVCDVKTLKGEARLELRYDEKESNINSNAKVTEVFRVEKINPDKTISHCTQPPIYAQQNIELWSPDTPVLYKLRAWLNVDGKLSDYKETKFAFRTIEFTKDSGFFLNGKHLWLQGANRHQDHAGWGDAVTNEAHYRDAKMIKDCGMNFVRGSHYPHDPAFLDACDELGLLFWSENTFWGIGGFKEDGYWDCSAYPTQVQDMMPFEENDKRLLAEMINDHYNHPSVIVWSMSNEPFFTHSTVMDSARNHMQEMLNLTAKLDSTRPGGIGGAQRQDFDKLGGVIGYNGDGAYFKQPQGPSIVAEYGSYVSNRPGIYDGTWGCTSANQLPWRSGQALWCAFHHGSIAGDMGRMGMIDYFRLPLRQWYFYRELYKGIKPPKWAEKGEATQLKIEASKNKIKTNGTDDAQLIVSVCDTNGNVVNVNPDVTLEIISGPGLFPTGKKITFKHRNDIDILEGQAAIAFRSYHSGKTLIRATAKGLKPFDIEIESIGGTPWKGEMASLYQFNRPYPRPDEKMLVEASKMLNNIAASRPTRFSSEELNNRAEFANDGNMATRWCATNGSTPAYWTVDLENFYHVTGVEIFFEKTTNFGFKVQVSQDERNWIDLAEYSADQPPQKTVKLSFKKPADSARFLRIYFTSTPANTYPGIVEILVSGSTK